MSKKIHEAYSLFRKKTPSGTVWYVKFWDSVTHRYGSVKSTGIHTEGKRERRREAEEAAIKLLASFEEKGAFSEVANKPLIQFLLDFWTFDSEYVREKRVVEKKPLDFPRPGFIIIISLFK